MKDAYSASVKHTQSGRRVKKAPTYLKRNGLLAVPYKKAIGFCLIREDTYENKLSDLLDSNQFSKKTGQTDSIVVKIKKDINKEMSAMNKEDTEAKRNCTNEGYSRNA